LSDNPFSSNCWLLAAEGSEEAIVVDPGFDADSIRSLLAKAGKRPAAALATHGHFDHVGAAEDLCGDELPFYIHAEDELALTDAVAWGAGFAFPPCRPPDTRTFQDGEVLRAAGIELTVIHTPGHTPGSACFKGEELLFSGDLVFLGAVGRHDFPNSSAPQMYASLRRFVALDDTAVYPGHGEATTVSYERSNNPFLLQLV
jgi:hydroxyacylglutathione hydrolase